MLLNWLAGRVWLAWIGGIYGTKCIWADSAGHLMLEGWHGWFDVRTRYQYVTIKIFRGR